ncbi:MAG: gliding motility protein GldL [Muribaculaceae bacterium]|nr:gliding motility protein GldL [Muribaculaceae bacterium]
MMEKEKLKNKIDTIMTWEGGQRLFNFAYSVGAAIVIWGALFKILHLPGGNTLLCIGMGTEVLMFILTAFDRPPKEYHWEEVFPELDKRQTVEEGSGRTLSGGGTIVVGDLPSGTVVSGAPMQPAATALGEVAGLSASDTQALSDSISRMTAAADQLSQMADLASATQDYLARMSTIAEQMEQLSRTTEALNQVSSVLLESYRTITENSADITANSQGYIARMADLNRNLGGLNTIYEIQLKSVSTQLDSIDRVNRGIKDIRDMYEKSASQSARYCEETEKMSRHIQQLNQVYEKMLNAMTVSMYRPMMNDIPGAASSGTI